MTFAAVDPNLWLFRDYMESFDEIPGLKELTATSLMVEITTHILHELKNELLGSDADEKARLSQLLGEPAAHATWESIAQWRSKTGKRDVIGRRTTNKCRMIS